MTKRYCYCDRVSKNPQIFVERLAILGVEGSQCICLRWLRRDRQLITQEDWLEAILREVNQAG